MNSISMFAQISPPEFGALITVIGGMLVGFYALIKYILASHEATQEKDRLERIALSEAITKMAEATAASGERQAKATEKMGFEAERRNGHLAELMIESKNGTIDAIQCMKVKQNVTEQHVETQVVEHEVTK